MTVTLPAICKGDTLMLLKPLEGFPVGTPVSVTITPESEREAGLKAGDEHFASAFGDDELRAFESAAYGQAEPDYGTLDSLE